MPLGFLSAGGIGAKSVATAQTALFLDERPSEPREAAIASSWLQTTKPSTATPEFCSQYNAERLRGICRLMDIHGTIQ